jgi:phage shock protein C
MNRLKYSVETVVFGVCSNLGKWMGIPVSYIRLFFIYFTFISIPSPIIVYLILAFWVNLKKFVLKKKDPIWE